jgi:hypothetical protein
MSDASDSYFQFPLCALSFCATEHERLEHVISYGFVDAGNTMFRKLNQDMRRLKAEELQNDPSMPHDFSATKNDHVAAMIGAREIGITVGNVRWSLEHWKKLSEFRTEFERKYGPDVEVRVRKGLVFEARDNTGISYREFAVLCAAYSCIGSKTYPVRVTRDTIRCRMLGYKSATIMAQELSHRTDDLKPLTLRQVNYVLDRLDERRFFARARANERQTFYSIRLRQEQLEQQLVEGKSYRDSFREGRIRRAARLIARVKAKRATIIVDAAIKVDDERVGEPNDVYSASAGVSAEVSASVSTLIKTPLIETPAIETLSTETQRNTAGAFEEFKKSCQKFERPSLVEVQQFGPTLNKRITSELAAKWFELFGSDLRWSEADWRKPCAAWLLGNLAMVKHEKARQTLQIDPGATERAA